MCIISLAVLSALSIHDFMSCNVFLVCVHQMQIFPKMLLTKFLDWLVKIWPAASSPEHLLESSLLRRCLAQHVYTTMEWRFNVTVRMRVQMIACTSQVCSSRLDCFAQCKAMAAMALVCAAVQSLQTAHSCEKDAQQAELQLQCASRRSCELPTSCRTILQRGQIEADGHRFDFNRCGQSFCTQKIAMMKLLNFELGAPFWAFEAHGKQRINLYSHKTIVIIFYCEILILNQRGISSSGPETG